VAGEVPASGSMDWFDSTSRRIGASLSYILGSKQEDRNRLEFEFWIQNEVQNNKEGHGFSSALGDGNDRQIG
jgi:hypothetical protein